MVQGGGLNFDWVYFYLDFSGPVFAISSGQVTFFENYIFTNDNLPVQLRVMAL